MICPSENCKKEIPDDSLFCDQCGIKLKKCETCGKIAFGNFCGKCGGKMIFICKNIVIRNKYQDE